MSRKQCFYFETSAVNYLFDNVYNDEKFSSVKTRQLQILKNRQWQISNVVLWEIFLTKDETRKHNLLDFSRSLFYESLMPSPEELILGYIAKDCPINEDRFPLVSKSLLANHWKIACNDYNYWFNIEEKQIENITNHLRNVNRIFNKKYNGFELKNIRDYNTISDKIDTILLKSLFKRLVSLFRKDPDEKEMQFISISFQLTMILLCYGIGIDFQLIESFWNRDRKTEPLERLGITIEKYPDVFFRGPIANMAKMILVQSKKSPGRGMYLDSMHSVYTTYADLFFTNDSHFLLYADSNDIDFNMKKIINIKEVEFIDPIEK